MTRRVRRSRAPALEQLPAWMDELAREVWSAEQLSTRPLPTLQLGRPARSTRGFYSYARGESRIVIRRHADARTMRSTLLHELAHAVHRLHHLERALCACEPRCSEDRHGPVFKRHLARIEHRHQPGTHSRWGLAGCLGRARVPAKTPWHSDIACPRCADAGSPRRVVGR